LRQLIPVVALLVQPLAGPLAALLVVAFLLFDRADDAVPAP
jgi:hypothetical protein